MRENKTDRKAKEVKIKRICVTEKATGKKTYFRAKTSTAAVSAASNIKFDEIREQFQASTMSAEEVLALPVGTVWTDLTGEAAAPAAASAPAVEPEAQEARDEAEKDF